MLSHGNVSYLMIAKATRLLLEGHTARDGGSTTPFEAWHRPLTVNRLSPMEALHVDAPTAAVYDNTRQRSASSASTPTAAPSLAGRATSRWRSAV